MGRVRKVKAKVSSKKETVDDGQPRFECHVCYRRYREEESYVTHMSKAHRSKVKDPLNALLRQKKCWYVDCGKTYQKCSGLRTHLVHFHKERRFAIWECTKCKATLYDKS